MILTTNWQEVFRYHINISRNRSVPFVTYAKINKQDNIENYSLVDLKIESHEVDYSSNAYASGCSSYLQGKYQNQGTYHFGTKTAQTHQIKITHDQEGKASVNISSSFNAGAWGSASGNKTVDLPQIPRGSRINNTETSFDLGNDSVTLNITKYVETYYDVLNISINNTILRTIDGVENGYVFTPTDAELDTIYYSMPNNKSQTITFTTTTYSNSDKTTQIGVASVFNIAGNIVNANPTLTRFDYEDTNPLTLNLSEDSNKIINGYSTLTIRNLVANANKGATLQLVQINNVQYPYNDNFSVSIPNWSGNVITMYVFDSRNNSTKLEVPIGINYVDYQEKVIISKNCTRYANVNEEAKLSFIGEWFNSSFGKYDNQLSATYRYKQKGGDTWIQGTTNININVDGNSYSYNGYIKGDTNNGFATENSYEIEILVTDSLSSKSATTILIAGEPAMDIYQSNVAIGGYYNEDEINYQAQFKKPVKFYNKVAGIFPIGSIYMSVNETDPKDLFGGTWERIKDTFLLACGDTYANGTTGGESEVTLTIDEMPRHTHTYTRSRLFYAEAAGQNAIGYGSNAGTAITAGTNSTGGGLAHNNMPPYLAVYVWKRIG